MFRNILRKAIIVNARNASTIAQKERWDLHVGVLIERLPIISKQFNEIEAEFMVDKMKKIQKKKTLKHANDNDVPLENLEQDRV